MNLRRRTTCRVCGSSALRQVIDLGPQYLQGSFRKEGMPSPPERKISCTLVRCCPEDDENACGLLQMQHSVPPEILYSTYWYRSGTNTTMREHLRGIVEEAVKMVKPGIGYVLDIGCNDGTLLTSYPKEWIRVGVDPSDAPLIDGVRVIKSVFPCEILWPLDGTLMNFDIITAIAMFYDIEDPRKFVRAVHSHLNEEGLWIVEMSYMPSMLEHNSYDTICHEHVEYYSLSVIERLCREAGLKIVRAELNSANGGSLRCYVAHARCTKYDKLEWQEAVQVIRLREFDLALDTDKPYRSFQERIESHRTELVGVLKHFKAEGKRIHLYGASTKGNTILQWCGIDSRLVECAADRNPEKDGAFTLGTDIPIVSEEKSRAMKPDVFLVLPWHFRDEFIERERVFLEAGGLFVFPLPVPEIVSKRCLK
jgi:hypothetical protein